MKYLILNFTSDSPGNIEIEKEEFESILAARKNLFELLFLEEKLDFVTENYYEFEQELLSIASRQMIFNEFDYFSISKERNLITRRIANLLSSCRMYLDHSSHHINNIYGKNSPISKKIKEEKSKYYDNFFGYRLLEALRNYTQHRGIPIHSLVLSHKREENNDDIHLTFNTNPRINIEHLLDDDNFKISIKDELKRVHKKNEIEIKPLIREYVESIGNIQVFIRELLKSEVIAWEDIIINIIDRYKNKFGENNNRITIASKNTEDVILERKIIFKDFLERRKILEKKNNSFTNLHICYSTNK